MFPPPYRMNPAVTRHLRMVETAVCRNARVLSNSFQSRAKAVGTIRIEGQQLCCTVGQSYNLRGLSNRLGMVFVPPSNVMNGGWVAVVPSSVWHGFFLRFKIYEIVVPCLRGYISYRCAFLIRVPPESKSFWTFFRSHRLYSRYVPSL